MEATPNDPRGHSSRRCCAWPHHQILARRAIQQTQTLVYVCSGEHSQERRWGDHGNEESSREEAGEEDRSEEEEVSELGEGVCRPPAPSPFVPLPCLSPLRSFLGSFTTHNWAPLGTEFAPDNPTGVRSTGPSGSVRMVSGQEPRVEVSSALVMETGELGAEVRGFWAKKNGEVTATSPPRSPLGQAERLG